MFETVDLYCERIGPGYWAEPVNAVTNVAFIIFAWLVWRLAGQRGVLSPGIWALVILMAAIGMGSGLFHTFATNWAQILDIVPIVLFQLVFLWIYCRRIVGMRFGYATGLLAIYFGSAMVAMQFPHLLNGSLMYAPAFVVLTALGGYHFATRRRERHVVSGAAAVFLVSLTCRTMDGAVCPYVPLGTHFLWHVLNGIVLYLVMRGLLANAQAARA